ncbi:replication protein A 70 kDa dna-binding subunit C-like [Trifolium medium]|uniref:Replication protein A 70 kDa dna-binding subunit C-like n=1 Tax=Trifolium medium TaxID=97028 RepID=A0A392LZ21_9FABA|nr:replication protein A 70 kDa dna-binding subunit C-like [Trifolium medium]
MPKFKDFVEIEMGKWREDLLYDVIGVVHDIGFTQAIQGSRKVQVNFRLKDLSDNKIQCTLWEHFAMRFITYTRENNDAGPTIVCMKYAKIKPEGKFPLTVSNTWATTKLFINDKIPEILDFKKRLSEAISNGTIAEIHDTPSQLMSQSSGGSMYTHEQKFCHKAEIMSLPQMMSLKMDTNCVTVVKTVRVRTNSKGWYYQACYKCPKTTSGENHLISVGVHEGENFIEELKSQFTSAQDPKPLPEVSSPLAEEFTSSQAVEDSPELDDVIPTVSLSASDEIDPNLLTMKTPSKRSGASLKHDNIEAGDLIGLKLSSTKMPKHPKME